MTSGPPSYRGATPPPAYESRPGSLHDYRSPPLASVDHPQTRQGEDAEGQDRAVNPSPTNRHENAVANHDKSESTEAGTSKRRLSFIQNATQAYKDKRRAKEAARKVDYYERLYGFVPKNAMTQAEWRDARERVPKTKVPFRARSRGMTALGLGGVAGGS